MLKTILKRILQSIPTLLIVITITFVLTRMIPGNPARTILGPQASAQDIAEMEIKLGLNKSKLEQYADYMIGILHGDFGTSYVYNRPVTSLIAERIPNTLVITLTSLVIAIFIGVGIGWLPALGMGSMSKGIGDVISHMVLPCFCLATIPTATFARITRSSMLEVIHSDSIKALRARGIKESSIIWKHALKNALPPIVTVLGLQLASAFTGAILTESIFSWPGMGTMIVSAIDNRDYMLIQGTVLFIAVVFVVVNLLVDVVYMIINPRVSYDSKGGN